MSTSTFHVRRRTWQILAAILVAMNAFTFITWSVCNSGGSQCLVGDAWDEDYWGSPSCQRGYCEKCYMDRLLRSSANSYSNVVFMMTGVIMFTLTIEDYIFFNMLSPGHVVFIPQDDYTSDKPPNLILGGGGMVNVLFGFAAMMVLFWAGIGAFVYHAGMTPLSAKYDICSVYTLVWLSLPYSAINHLHCIKRKIPRIILFCVIICVVLSFIYPFEYHQGIDANKVVPQYAALNYLLLLSGYVWGAMTCQVKLRKWTDVWVIGFAISFMYLAYLARERDGAEEDETWCLDEDSIFQPHALGHSSMAIGIVFFYLFLRQERPWNSERDSPCGRPKSGSGEWIERVEKGWASDSRQDRVSSGSNDGVLQLTNINGDQML